MMENFLFAQMSYNVSAKFLYMDLDMKKFITSLLALFIIMGGVLYFWKKPKKEFSHFTTVQVTRGDIIESVEATGVIKPSIGAEVKIGARVSGMVIDEPIKIGDFVKKGTIIAKIDDAELQQSHKIAQKEFTKIQKTYPLEIEKLKKSVKKAAIEEQKAALNLEAAQADAATAQWLCKNKKKLLQKHATSQKEYRTICTEATIKQKAVQKAKLSLKQAKENLQEAQLSLEKLQKSFKYDKAIARAKLNQAKIRLEYATIKAPFDGIITYISTQKGETVVAGLNAPQFAKILDPKKIENRIYIDETAIAKIKRGMQVIFNVDALPQNKFHGRIVQIYPQPEIQNSVVYYIAVMKDFENSQLLRPEMTTHNKIIIQVHKNVLRLPNAAVKFKNGHFFVYHKKGNKIIEKEVQTGISDEHYTQILSGLQEGDIVLVEQKHAH